MDTKSMLRQTLRQKRREHSEALGSQMAGLIFNRPPRALADKVAPSDIVGLYDATRAEAPTRGYARFFAEAGCRLALPFMTGRSSAMVMREHTDPFDQSDLEKSPFGPLQPSPDAALLVPDILFVPLLGFTREGARLGQGGGHYDRWLEEHRASGKPRLAIGLAWDIQLCDELPLEAHDQMLDAIITPTAMYGQL